MSKEVLETIAEDDDDTVNSAFAGMENITDPVIQQTFSFWANLMVLGDTDTCDLLCYPSFSSKVDSRSHQVHRMRNAMEWESLSTEAPISRPVVELIV